MDDAVERPISAPDGVDSGGVGGPRIDVDAADEPAPGLHRVEDRVGGVAMRDLVVAPPVLLVDELDGYSVGVLEAGVEVGEGRAA